MKMCIACGMPMTSISDYPLQDISKNYCKYCAHADGTMKTFHEKLTILSIHYANHHNIEYEIAKDIAFRVLRKLPAWRGR